jgi:hypothetical protein
VERDGGSKGVSRLSGSMSLAEETAGSALITVLEIDFRAEWKLDGGGLAPVGRAIRGVRRSVRYSSGDYGVSYDTVFKPVVRYQLRI